jgi:hypothetical protein
MDLFTDVALRDPVNPFVQLLWDRGNAYEQEIIEKLDMPFTNLKHLSPEEKETQTYEAMSRGDDLIYGGRIRADDLGRNMSLVILRVGQEKKVGARTLTASPRSTMPFN